MQSLESIPLVTAPELERLEIALQALPQVAPERSAWEDISRQLQTSQPHRAQPRVRTPRWMAYAAAASIILASGWLVVAQRDRLPIDAADGMAARGSVASGSPGSAVTPSAHDALVARSGSLERWLVDSGSAQWPQDFGSASASVEIENLIAHVDQRLTRSSSDTERDQLWQRRVALLEQLVTLQGEPMALWLPASDRTQLL